MKISDNQKLFAELIISLLEQMYENHNNTLSELCDPVRNKNRELILDEIAKIMLKYNIKDSSMNISKIEQSKLYHDLCTKINEMFSNEFDTEKECISDILESTAKDSYYINSFVTSTGIDYTLKHVSDKVLQEIINHKIDDKPWNDFLWNDKVELRKDLKLQIKKFLNGEINVNDIRNAIQKKYKNNRYVTTRLVNDNIAHVQEEANKVWKENHNITTDLYMGTLDYKICDKCKPYDGKTFNINEGPQPPIHVGCRCTRVAIINENWRPSQRLDNVTKEKVDWQTYEEWMENYNNGLDNENKLIDIPEETLKHVNEGDFTNPKNPKNIKAGEIRLKGGGHSQRSIELLNQKKIEYNIVKEYDNGVRIGNVPKHKLNAKQNGTGQAWFPKDWTDKDIQKSAEYVANLKDKSNYIIEKKYKDDKVSAIFKYANYNGVTVGVCYETSKGKITTIFPDETQRMLGDDKND